MVAQPVWCKCGGHSWTRRQLYAAWEKNRSIHCPAPGCGREILSETVEEVLIREGIVVPDEEAISPEGDG